MGQRPSRLEPRNIRDQCMRSEVEENLVARQRPRAAIIQPYLEGFRGHKAAGPHDQFGPA